MPALLAAAVLALQHTVLAGRLEAWRKRQTADGRGLSLTAHMNAHRRRSSRARRHDRHPGRRSAGPDAGAGRRLGYRPQMSCLFAGSPTRRRLRGGPPGHDRGLSTDTAALARFAADVDVVTYEFENVPADAAPFLSARKPVLPDPRVLAITQDRLIEKQFIAELGIGTARFEPIDSPDALRPALDRIGRPAILKTAAFGYDGKGQVTIGSDAYQEDAWARDRSPGRDSGSAVSTFERKSR